MMMWPPTYMIIVIRKRARVAGATRRGRCAGRARARIGGGHSISGGSVRGTRRWWARFAKSDALTEMRGAASYGRSSRSYRRIAAGPDWLPMCTYRLDASLRARVDATVERPVL